MTLTDDGQRRATELFEAYGIKLDPEPQPQRFFRLRLQFDFDSLVCMRTLLVPTHTTFEDFHTQIQACLNWMNYHLYDFTFTSGDEEYYVAWPDYETGEDPRTECYLPDDTRSCWLNAATTYLDDFLPRLRTMTYSYDYGDSWAMRIDLINQKEEYASDVPFCWEGVGDAPPEDVGGEDGFAHFLQVLDDPSDEDYAWLKGWGEGQGFEHFSKRAANRRLAHWWDWAREDVGTMPRDAQRAAFGKVLVEPVGSTESHGPQLTLVTGGHRHDEVVGPSK